MPEETAPSVPSEAESPLEQALGDLGSSARPELAIAEQEASQAAEAGEPETDTVGDVQRRVAAEKEPAGDDTPAEPDEGGEEQAKAPEGEPGKPEDQKVQFELDAKATVQSILEKFQFRPEGLARAVKGLQRLVSRKDLDINTLRSEISTRESDLSRLAAFVEQYGEETGNGEIRLKPDAAARVLQAQRSKRMPPPVDERAVRAEIEKQFRERLSEKVADEEEIQELMDTMKTQIDVFTKERVTSLTAARKDAELSLNQEVGQIVMAHLAKRPDDKEYLPAVAEFLERFPEEIRSEAIVEGWVSMPWLFDTFRFRNNMEQALMEAYVAGTKQSAAEASGGGAPGGSANAPRKTGSRDADQEAFKEAVLRAGTLPPIESIFER